MENLKLYNDVRSVPETAKKTIQAGRLKGFTDINPMWRLKLLTEQFGPCGIGWYYIQTEKQFVPGGKGEVAVFIEINLYVKFGDEWSKPIPGSGGSMFVSSERNGLYTSDEAIKMATTDAIGSACKLLGFGADVYWEKDRTKYDRSSDSNQQEPEQTQKPAEKPPLNCADCHGIIASAKANGKEFSPSDIAKNTQETYGKSLCWKCAQEAAKCQRQ